MPSCYIFGNGHNIIFTGLATTNFTIGNTKIVTWTDTYIESTVVNNNNECFLISSGGTLFSNGTLNTVHLSVGAEGAYAYNNEGTLINCRSIILTGGSSCYKGSGVTFDCSFQASDLDSHLTNGGTHYRLKTAGLGILNAESKYYNCDFSHSSQLFSNINIEFNDCNIIGDAGSGNVTFVYTSASVLSCVFNNCVITRTAGASTSNIMGSTSANSNIEFNNCKVTNLFGNICASSNSVNINGGIWKSLKANISGSNFEKFNAKNCIFESLDENNIVSSSGTGLVGTLKNVTFITPSSKVALTGSSTRYFNYVDCTFTQGRALSTIDLVAANPQRLLDCSDAHGNTGIGLVSKFPKMTETERDALTGVGKCYTVENTTADELQTYNGTTWKTLLDLA
jgi:hypothetical protein